MLKQRILLQPEDLPRKWYNLAADLPNPLPPPLHPATRDPAPPEMLAVIFPMNLLEQEMSQDRWIDIPEPILDELSNWRPSPLVRADQLEQALGTPAKIFYKNESLSPAGSHKPNTAIAQAYYNKQAGTKRIATETGAGQWGSALAYATCRYGLECTVYMVKISFQQKPYRKSMINSWGATIHPSPSDATNTGRAVLENDPDCLGSLGIAISEACEDAATHDDTKYSLGSVLNHVCTHQTIIGLEAKKQFEIAGVYPDILIGCAGGGSNLAGFAFPFIHDKLDGKDVTILAVEPAACPTMTRGQYAYDFGDTAETTPLLKMHTLGHTFMPPGIHAGGLRYHGMAPSVSACIDSGLIEARNVHQVACFEAGALFSKTEGIIPAPETCHAIRLVIDEALKCKETGEEKVIGFNFSGHGHFDMGAYDKYFSGELEDYDYPEEHIKESLAKLP